MKTMIYTALICIMSLYVLTGCVDKNMSSDISDDQALAAIKEYCYISNPDLKDMEIDEQYTIFWDVSVSDGDKIVILYRSYTGAEVRYYINRITGETYVTEFVSGMMEEEQRTEETFNIKDYIN